MLALMQRAYSHCKSPHLEQKTVARLLLDRGLYAEGVGHSQIITDALDLAVLDEVCPCLPVILVEGILDGDNGVLLDEVDVEVREFSAGDPVLGVGVGVLEVKIVFAVLVEFR